MKKGYLKSIIITSIVATTLLALNIFLIYSIIAFKDFYNNINKKLSYTIMTFAMIILPAIIVVAFEWLITCIGEYRALISQIREHPSFNENDLSTEDLKTLQFEYFLRVYIATNKITDDKKIKEIEGLINRKEEILDLIPEVDILDMSADDDYDKFMKTIGEVLNGSNIR